MPKFDPEGEGFDIDLARKWGMERDDQGHMGSVVPISRDQEKKLNLPRESFVLLKGRRHPTFDKAVAAEEARGFVVMKIGDRYFSVPQQSGL